MGKLFLAILFAVPLNAFAWGNLGHKVIAEVASRHLDANAKATLTTLLGQDDFSSAAVWADRIKRSPDWRHTSSYHYVDIDDDSNYLDMLSSRAKAKLKKGDVVMAILTASDVLKNRQASLADRRNALKFLIHFVGDLHQPLHTGRPEDAGGNDISVKWYGKTVKLHELWDSKLISKAHENDLDGLEEADQVKWYSDYIDLQSLKGSSHEFDVLAWITEAMAARTTAYTGYDGPNDAYLRASIPVIERQLFNGAMDLAALLNTLVSGRDIPDSQAHLKSEIERIVGSRLDGVIHLTPQANANQGDDSGEAFHDD